MSKNPFDSIKEPKPTMRERPRLTQEQEATIEIPLGLTLAQLRPFCALFSCTVESAGNGYFIITGTPTNLYWLGANMNNGNLESNSITKWIKP